MSIKGVVKRPGKYIKKPVADMTPEEYECHRLYTRFDSKLRRQRKRDPNYVKPPNKYPGKQCSKPVADMTAEEYEQHVIYNRAVYAWKKDNWSKAKKASVYNSVARKRSSKAYYKENKQRIIDRGIAYRKNVKSDPVLFKEYKERELARSRRKIENLSHGYVVGLVQKCTKLPIDLITQDMVDIHRATLVIKRLIKTVI